MDVETVAAERRVLGDAFEMEDQRNWADASFKTYVRPLSKPRPYVIAKGASDGVMIAAMPMVDELLMVLNAHPQVYVDISADNWGVPRAEFHAILKRIVAAGYGRRIMFGSDQMVWPQTIEVAIDAITEADYLSEDQKRDILYNNAARFLRLTDAEIASDHAAL